MENTALEKSVLNKRKTKSLILRSLVWLCGILTVGILAYILLFILVRGIPNINMEFLFGEYNSESLSAFFQL